eukprot:gene2754-biopygen2978
MTAQTAATQGEDYALCKGVGTDDVADVVRSVQTRERLTRDPRRIVAPATLSDWWEKKISVIAGGTGISVTNNEALKGARWLVRFEVGRGLFTYIMVLKGAFTLMLTRPESVPLLAVELTGGVSMLYHTGLHGSTSMSGAFVIITKTLRRWLNAELGDECRGGEEWLWKIASIDARCERGENSALQKVMEYTAVTLAIGYMVKYGVREETDGKRGARCPSRNVGGARPVFQTAIVDTGIFQYAGMVASKKSLAPDEYTAVALAIGYLVKYGVREETVCVKGDSVSSLKWAETERVKGNLCTSAAICMLAPLTVGSIDIINSVHVNGDSNILCDQLSRGVKPSELGYQQTDTVASKAFLPSSTLRIRSPNPVSEASHSATKECCFNVKDSNRLL